MGFGEWVGIKGSSRDGHDGRWASWGSGRSKDSALLCWGERVPALKSSDLTLRAEFSFLWNNHPLLLKTIPQQALGHSKLLAHSKHCVTNKYSCQYSFKWSLLVKPSYPPTSQPGTEHPSLSPGGPSVQIQSLIHPYLRGNSLPPRTCSSSQLCGPPISPCPACTSLFTATICDCSSSHADLPYWIYQMSIKLIQS